ncbi:hypothetical protein [Salmonella enterica]|uniref:hypothetical protein n=1 Tax=Salmonella enterica TaxID=28901 RepID=UPI0018CBF067|nr:hypothetical protein [Salmonella enterica]
MKGANFATERAINLAKQLNEPEKPTVKQFVADWFEDNFEELDWELGGVLINALIRIEMREVIFKIGLSIPRTIQLKH